MNYPTLKILSIFLVLFGTTSLKAQFTVPLGGPVTSSSVFLVDIEVAGETPYVAYADHRNQLHLKKLSGSDWEGVGTFAQTIKTFRNLDLRFNEGAPHILFSGSSGALSLLRLDEGKWIPVGSSEFARDDKPVDASLHFLWETPYVIYRSESKDMISGMRLSESGEEWERLEALESIPEGATQPALWIDEITGIFVGWFDEEKEEATIGMFKSDGPDMEIVGEPMKASGFVGFNGGGTDVRATIEAAESGELATFAYQILNPRWKLMDAEVAIKGEEVLLTENFYAVVKGEEGKLMAYENYCCGWESTPIKASIGAVGVYAACEGESGLIVAYSSSKYGGKLIVEQEQNLDLPKKTDDSEVTEKAGDSKHKKGKKSEPITLLTFRTNYTMTVGQLAEFAGSVHGSVGEEVEVWSTDESILKMVEKDFEYDNPQKSGMSGGDAGTKSYVFEAVKAGEVTVMVRKIYRGEEKDKTELKIVVTE